MQLLGFLHDSYLLRRSLRAPSASALAWSIGKFNSWLERPSTFDDLDEEKLSRFIRDNEPHHEPTYLKRLRGDLLTIWRDAADIYPSQVRVPNPKRVRAVKVPRKPPEAWTVDEVRRLLKACDDLDGFYAETGIRRSSFWKAFIGLAWDTGLRPSDVVLLRFDQIRDGSLAITQQKTSVPHWAPLSAATLASVAATKPPDRELILPWSHTKQTFLNHFAELTAAAGLVGTPKKLRKSAASEVERQQPGAAQQFLGHLTPGLAYKNYVDPRVANPQRPRPQSLDDA